MLKVIQRLLLMGMLQWPHFLPAAQNNATNLSNADAVSGTWLLQQVDNVESLRKVTPGISAGLRVAGVRGFSLRVPWNAIDKDFTLLEEGLKVAREHRVEFTVRFMAGRHTPRRIFEKGCAAYTILKYGQKQKAAGAGQKAGPEKVPTPFLPDGKPNQLFLDEYDQFVGRLAAWCGKNGVRLLHLAWFGQDWAELNHGKEVRAAPGYSYENWLNAHLRLIDIGLKYAGEKLAVELPFSGYGPCTEPANAFADYVVAKIGPANPIFFCQANGWNERGEWGAPDPKTHQAFDKVWTRPICRGLQMIQPQDYDWRQCYQRLYDVNATYCEVYMPSFSVEHGMQYQSDRSSNQLRKLELAGEIKKFAEACKKKTPMPARQ